MSNNMWKNKPTKNHLSKLLSDNQKLADVANIQKARLNSADGERERRQLSAAITISRYGDKPIDKPIDETLDEPGERQSTARWLNEDIEGWVKQVSREGWHWMRCNPDDLLGLTMKSDFAYFCYQHLS